MEHTQLPWKIDQRAYTHIVGANGRHVATSGGYASNLPADRDTFTDENAANAAFIVRAGNAHQALVDLLTEARAWMDGDVMNDPWEKAFTERIDAALKQARGEE